MNKKWMPHVITLGALIVFLVLGLACGTSEPAVKVIKLTEFKSQILGVTVTILSNIQNGINHLYENSVEVYSFESFNPQPNDCILLYNELRGYYNTMYSYVTSSPIIFTTDEDKILAYDIIKNESDKRARGGQRAKFISDYIRPNYRKPIYKTKRDENDKLVITCETEDDALIILNTLKLPNSFTFVVLMKDIYFEEHKLNPMLSNKYYQIIGSKLVDPRNYGYIDGLSILNTHFFETNINTEYYVFFDVMLNSIESRSRNLARSSHIARLEGILDAYEYMASIISVSEKNIIQNY